VFYDKGSYGDGDWRYLEAAPYGWYDGDVDPGTQFQWGARGYAVDPSAKATAVGTGENNTANILAYHDSLETLYPSYGSYYGWKTTKYYCDSNGTVAAKECSEYSVEYEGTTYDDWFLPSKDELTLMYTNLYMNSIGGFSSNGYWSSSEIDSSNAYYQSFTSSSTSESQYPAYKNSNARFRAIRAF
jgi:hypothetical protein